MSEIEEKSTWKRYTEWVGSGFKASFTRDNILSINTALGTFFNNSFDHGDPIHYSFRHGY